VLVREIRGNFLCFILKDGVGAGKQDSALSNAWLVVDSFMQPNRFTSTI